MADCESTPPGKGHYVRPERPLVAESGSQNYVFPALLTSAMPPIAAVELILS